MVERSAEKPKKGKRELYNYEKEPDFEAYANLTDEQIIRLAEQELREDIQRIENELSGPIGNVTINI